MSEQLQLTINEFLFFCSTVRLRIRIRVFRSDLDLGRIWTKWKHPNDHAVFYKNVNGYSTQYYNWVFLPEKVFTSSIVFFIKFLTEKRIWDFFVGTGYGIFFLSGSDPDRGNLSPNVQLCYAVFRGRLGEGDVIKRLLFTPHILPRRCKNIFF